MPRLHGYKTVGFWNDGPFCSYPKPNVDLSWSGPERDQVLAHLDAGIVVESYLGWAECRMPGCSKRIGSKDLSDGVWVWPEGFAHYIREHHVKPDEEFIRHTQLHRPPFTIKRSSSWLDDLEKRRFDDGEFRRGVELATSIVEWWRRRSM